MSGLLTRFRDRRLVGQASRAQTMAFGAAAFPIQLMAQAGSAFIVYFYADHLRIPAEWIAAGMIAHGILTAALNLIVGTVSDRTRTPWGRRIPWIVFGIVPMVVCFVLIWTPPALGPVGLLIWFLVVVAVYDVVVVAVVLNISALFPEIFRTTAERARGNTPRQVFGLLGMILGTACAPLLYGTIGWAGMAICLAIIGAGFFAWSLAGMIERPGEVSLTAPTEPELTWREQISYTFANRAFRPYVLGSLLLQCATSVTISAIPFYVRYGLHEDEIAGTPMLAAIFATALPALAGWSWLVRRTSPRTAILWAVAAYGIASVMYLLPTTLTGAMIVGASVGIGVAGMLQLLEIALSQVIDDDEQRTGLRREGIYFGVNGFIVKGAVIVQALVTAAVLKLSGYDPALGAGQPPSVEVGFRILMGVVPLCLTALAWLCYWRYPLRTANVVPSHRIATAPDEVPVVGRSE